MWKDRTNISLYIPSDFSEVLKAAIKLCAKEGISFSELVRELVIQYVIEKDPGFKLIYSKLESSEYE